MKTPPIVFTLFLAFALFLSACGASPSAPVTAVEETAALNTPTESASAAASFASADSAQAGSSPSHEEESDYAWDSSSAVSITLNGTSAAADSDSVQVKGGVVKITSAGTYLLSGALSAGQILVETADEDPVRLVLNGIQVTGAESSPFFIAKAKKVIVILAEGSQNTLTDSASYVFASAEEDEPNAALFSKADLTIAGSGALTVNAQYNDGIASKDGLLLAGGTLTVNAVDDGLRGKDYLIAKNVTLTVNAGGDALKSDNEEDPEKGYITIESGVFEIVSGDDGIHAESSLTINGGEMNISQSYEGLESAVITINGGTIRVTASDDGINVAGGTDSSGAMPGGRQQPGGQETFNYSGSYYLYIHGGYIVVNARGDGLDANGAIEMTDGVVIVNGPTEQMNGALDYDGGFTMSGGVFVAAGSAGMAQAPGAYSSQNSVLAYFPNLQAAGTLVHIEDSAGNEILTFAPLKDFQTLVFSAPSLRSGDSYTFSLGGTSSAAQADGLYQSGGYAPGSVFQTFSVSQVVTTLGSGGGGMRPGRP